MTQERHAKKQGSQSLSLFTQKILKSHNICRQLLGVTKSSGGKRRRRETSSAWTPPLTRTSQVGQSQLASFCADPSEPFGSSVSTNENSQTIFFWRTSENQLIINAPIRANPLCHPTRIFFFFC